MAEDTNKILADFENLLTKPIETSIFREEDIVRMEDTQALKQIHSQIKQRIEFIEASIIQTATNSKDEVEKAILLLRDWMLQGSIVRIIGAGRARLAGSIPANRLAHGGAHVYIQDDIIPMPHSIKGGGIIAVSGSGKTQSVLDVLKSVREKSGNIKIIGIANKDAEEFQSYCDIFIGIEEDIGLPNPLRALADTGEYVISELFDAMVVAAGKLAGFDDTTWRLGHEDIGATGPYGMRPPSDIDMGHSLQ